jgi:hypothetical protein
VVIDDISAGHTLLLQKSKKKDVKGFKGDKTAKALKELVCFGEFNFDSRIPKSYNTRNGGEISGIFASTSAEEGGGVKKAAPKEKKPCCSEGEIPAQ